MSDSIFRNAYYHFEALTDHSYDYYCLRCGHHPPILIWDLCKKGCFPLARKLSYSIYFFFYIFYISNHFCDVSTYYIKKCINTIFNVTLPTVDDLEVPMPSEENDVVDIDSFWNKMETSLVERGLAKGN